MIQHLPDLTRPETEIERIIRELEPKPPDDIPRVPVQVPGFGAWPAERRNKFTPRASGPTPKGFRNPNDPRIPAALRRAAIANAQQPPKRGRRKP